MDVFNLSTGTSYSVLEIVESFDRSNSAPVKYEFDLPELWASADKARDILGWTAQNHSQDEIFFQR